jgi:endonuclease/exonuclease/phosphatase family metal-dependent hydrolase
MKILTLNTWGGRVGKEKLLNFLKEQSKDVDIFCLQEVWAAPYEHLEGVAAGGLKIQHGNILTYGLQEISAILLDFSPYFHPSYQDNYGLLTLVRKSYEVQRSDDIWVHEHKDFIPQGDIGHHARNLQFVTITHNHDTLTVCNFHGLWNGKGKTDSDDRILQSNNIVKFIKELDGEVALCGDFNLLPDTESIKILADAGLRNLVREYGITSTRTSYYTKPEKFADYAFVSDGLKVIDFKVLTEEVSDHAPLLLEIE